jgi:hypothetical protein
LHLRWRKHSCAKDLVRGAEWRTTLLPWLACRFELSGTFWAYSVYTKCYLCLSAVSPLSLNFGTGGSTAGPARAAHFGGATKVPPTGHHSTQMLSCLYRYRRICADVPAGGDTYRPGGGGGCGCTSKEMDPGSPPLKSCTQHRTYDQRLRLHHQDHPCRVIFVLRASSTMATP